MTRTVRNHMSLRRLLLLAAILGALALALGLLTSTTPTAKAAQAQSSRRCSDKTLRGQYDGTFSGTSSSTGPLAGQAETTLNGNGTGNSDVTLMTETSGPTAFTAVITYTLNSNCSGTFTSMRSTGETVHYNITVALRGTKLYLLQTDPGFVVTGVQDHV